MSALGPVAQDRPGVARVDDLLDAESLRRAERRPDRVEPLLDLRPESLGVLGGFELAPVGGLDAALDRERAPVAGRPRVAQVEARVVPMARAGDAEDLADEHRHPRHGRLVAGVEGARAAPYRAGPLRGRPDHEPGLVDEVHD